MEELNKCVNKAAELTGHVCGITDEEGKVIACSDDAALNTQDQLAREVYLAEEVFSVRGDKCYRSVQDSMGNIYIAFIDDTDDISQSYLQLICCWLDEMLYDAKTELGRDSLLKNILLENELPGDIPLKSREYRISYSMQRLAIWVQMTNAYSAENLEILRTLFPNRRSDFVLSMDEQNVVILKEVGHEYEEQVKAVCAKILAKLKYDNDNEICIGVGMPAQTLKDCAKSYREASLALTVGDIFNEEERVMYYDRLGLGRLIYQLPATLCQMFLDEVFPNNAYANLDEETIATIDKFFENNLNGSESSRQLFVHRNTLVYRLDKVQKVTNLDLRKFDDAVMFKLATMVRQYLERQNSNNKERMSRWWRN